MPTEEFIDFTRGDAGWILWITIPALALLSLSKRDFIGGIGKALKPILGRLVVGLILAALFVGLLEVWVRLGPQYFTKLWFDENSLRLRFHWSMSDTIVRLSEVRAISVVKSGTRRRPCNRVQIETRSQKLQSLGFGRLDADQVDVLDNLRGRIATNSVFSLER